MGTKIHGQRWLEMAARRQQVAATHTRLHLFERRHFNGQQSWTQLPRCPLVIILWRMLVGGHWFARIEISSHGGRDREKTGEGMRNGVRGREIGGWRKIWTNGGGRAQPDLGRSSLQVSTAQGAVRYRERMREEESSPLSSSDWVTMTQSIPLIFFF